MDLYVFLPCYNEALNIASLIESWNSHRAALRERGFALRVFGIDDCSTDGTRGVILEMAEKYDNVSLLPHEVNRGLRGGLNTSISRFLALGQKGDLMALMDGDNTHDPKYIFAMLDKLQAGRDCVTASRYCADSSIEGVASHREFLSDMARLYYKLLLRVPEVEDYTCGYRLYTYEIIEKLVARFGAAPVVDKSFACMMELLYRLYLVGAAFGEVGFCLRYDNKKGASKMRVLKTMTRSLIGALKLRGLK
ncbi:MAG: glycosyltransferase [Oscillospiraceae bacterium]|nr:glycosyltransferase [Oscillospiraceae bacterium]